jgi:protein SCO1
MTHGSASHKSRPFLILATAVVFCRIMGVPAAAQSVGGGELQDSSGVTAPADDLPPILRSVGITQRLGAQIPLGATFKDEDGRTVALNSYFGTRPVLLILAYYRCPMLCSEVLSGAVTALKKVGFKIGKQFEVLTVSFDPRDTPEIAAAKKATFIKEYGDPLAASGWHFLTGQKPQIDSLANAVGFHYSYDPKTGQYAHAAGLVVISPKGKVSQYFYGIEFPSRDLHLAIVQSSAEKIGSLADEVILYCCKYDPGTGRYQAVIARVLQIVGGFTILIIGGGLLLFFRMDRRNRVVKS